MQSKIAHAAERKAFSVALDQIIKAASGDDREKNLDKLINMAGTLLKDTAPGVTRGLKAGLYPGSKWEQFLWSVIDETDPHVLKTVVLNGGYESAFRGLRNTTPYAEKWAPEAERLWLEEHPTGKKIYADKMSNEKISLKAKLIAEEDAKAEEAVKQD